MQTRHSIALALAAVALLFAPAAHAESGHYNLHLSGLGPLPAAGEASFDWQLAQPFALELRAGGGVLTDFFQTTEGLFYATVGARLRFADDQSGYLDEGGSVAGHFWIAPHVGLLFAESGPAFLVDGSVGYDFSLFAPVSVGPFFRAGIGVGEASVVGFVAGGVQVSIEIDPIREPDTDLDGDGVMDRRDRCPSSPPGLAVDALGCTDEDGDGVIDDLDMCPGTPEGADVDGRGCVLLPPELVLEGIEFRYDSAEILPGSEPSLLRAAQALRDNPDVRVEVGGHTDDVGGRAYNDDLSLQRATAVRDWLVARGVDPARLEVRGYGSAQPRVENVDEASRARNRRIEFRQLP